MGFEPRKKLDVSNRKWEGEKGLEGQEKMRSPPERPEMIENGDHRNPVRVKVSHNPNPNGRVSRVNHRVD